MRNPYFQSTRRMLRKTVLLLSAFTVVPVGCNSQSSETPGQEEEASISATFAIQAADFYTSSGASKTRAYSASSLHSAQAFAFTDVASIRIDVKPKDSSTPLYVNFDLFKSADQWTGTIPFLPKGKALVFSAKASDATGKLLFQGTTEQTLSIANDKVVITLAAANDGQSITIPRVKKISVPSAFGSDQSGNVSFSVEANTGEALTYELTPAEGGGTFYPLTGSITLAATAGTFVSQYVPPSVGTAAEYTHTVKVTNEAGHSVVTTFQTKVKPAGTTDGVRDSLLQVQFSPVINSITTHRIAGTGNVLFKAAVADDDAEAVLGYTWSFTPGAGTAFDPMPAFSGETNPVTLEHYTTQVQGTVKLEVKDSKGAKTTLLYPLTPDQFPDNPVAEGPVTGFNSIRAGDAHTCVLLNNGTMRCWGYNNVGQLGYGNTFNIGDNEKPYVAGDVALVGTGAKIAVGGSHTCALFDTGLVRCWGHNGSGQLGYNTTQHVGDGEAIASYGYVNVGGIVVKLAAGGSHTCALMDTGKVRCWGYNYYGQLGYGNTQNVGDNEQPWSVGDVNVGGTVKDIVAGGNSTCALMDTGKVRCWGYNGYGQLGYGNTTQIGDNESPSVAGDVNVGGSVLQLSAGYNHICALLTTGFVRCWGYNGSGQLGYGHTNYVYSPANVGDVSTGGKVLQVAAGSDHTCALLSSGGIKCWGYGADGRLGYGNTSHQYAPPSSTVDLDGATAYQVTAGGAHSCALLSTGAARCWGYNSSGQLGYGNTSNIGDNELPSTAGDIQVLAPTP
ncbi:RCC1 domain-containing protein [Stigmatella erecta]|uniref:Alpha-tubulin suppressor n=1 Tax=Stigmatella erecta TaxID=83460 RepID=A0A1I0KT73_9BACT|nr:RTX toxin [Stigmatella erecta]SEU28347.1 Alpha-tubulin suppressor [Stigmatella erecta]